MVNHIQMGLLRSEPNGEQIWKVLNRLTAAEMRTPAGYAPVGIWAERRGYTIEQTRKLVSHGQLWVTKDIPATMRVGSYRFIHLNATVRESKKRETYDD